MKPIWVRILSQMNPVHVQLYYYYRSILILFSHLRLIFTSRVLPSDHVYMNFYRMRAIFSAHLILLDEVKSTYLQALLNMTILR